MAINDTMIDVMVIYKITHSDITQLNKSRLTAPLSNAQQAVPQVIHFP